MLKWNGGGLVTRKEYDRLYRLANPADAEKQRLYQAKRRARIHSVSRELTKAESKFLREAFESGRWHKKDARKESEGNHD